MEKKNAIMLSINDNYSFAAAAVMLSIKDNSPKVFDMCDFVIYHDGISVQNQETLLKIKGNAKLIKMSHNLPEVLYTHHKLHHWGDYILQKINAFELINTYKRVVWFDSDIYINSELDYLFEADFDIAFKPGGQGSGKNAYPHLLRNPDDNPLGPHGAVVAFNDSMLRFKINYDELSKRAEEVMKDNKRGGSIDETFLSYLTYYYGFNVLHLGHKYNTGIYFPYLIFDAAVQHFAEDKKPWRADFIYRTFPKWSETYKKFIELGGGNYPNLNKQNTFFDNEYSMDVLHYISILRPVFMNLDINKDKLFYFDFFNASKKPRFNFRKLVNLLYIEIGSTYISPRLDICLIMDKKINNKKHESYFKILHDTLKVKHKNTNLIEMTDGGLCIAVQCGNIMQLNAVLNELITLAKEKLYPYIFCAGKLNKKQKIINGMIKPLLDRKKYKKLKNNPSLFFTDSKSTFIKLLGKYYF